ncbi:MAG: hypothetical protein U0556_16150 [Dehalococcoidia bacterium]
MIEMGLLWYEPSRGVPLADRIDAAAERYSERFGELPNICLVAQSEIAEFDRVAVRSDRRIRPGYLLIGIERGEDLADWRPLRRSSDEEEVALLAADGTVLQTLRPAAQPKPSRKSAKVAEPTTSRSRAKRTVTVKPGSPRQMPARR